VKTLKLTTEMSHSFINNHVITLNEHCDTTSVMYCLPPLLDMVTKHLPYFLLFLGKKLHIS